MITYDIAIHAKIIKTLSPPAPCSLLPAPFPLPPCSPNDKYLTGHDIIGSFPALTIEYLKQLSIII